MKKFLAVILIFSAFITPISVLGAAGYIINDRVMVPVRGVFDELNFIVDWNNDTSTATIKDEKNTIIIKKGETTFSVNGEIVLPEVPQRVVDGNFFVPIKAIGDSIGADISWDSESKMAHISYNGRDSYINCQKQFNAEDIWNEIEYVKNSLLNIDENVNFAFENLEAGCDNILDAAEISNTDTYEAIFTFQTVYLNDMVSNFQDAMDCVDDLIYDINNDDNLSVYGITIEDLSELKSIIKEFRNTWGKLKDSVIYSFYDDIETASNRTKEIYSRYEHKIKEIINPFLTQIDKALEEFQKFDGQ